MCITKRTDSRLKANQQQGFVLVLALVMLSVITLIGVSSMNSANTELKATANAKHHQIAFHATQSLLEYTVSAPGIKKIDYLTKNKTPVVYSDEAGVGDKVLGYTKTPNSSAVSAAVRYLDCSKGKGSSMEEGKGIGFNLFDVKGTAKNLKGTAVSNQTLGVSIPVASCPRRKTS